MVRKKKEIPDRVENDRIICDLLPFLMYPTYGGPYVKHTP